MNEKIEKALYATKYTFALSGSAKTTTGTSMAAGAGKSASAPKSATRPKVNNVIKVLDDMFVNKSMNMLTSDSAVYTEFLWDGDRYSCIYDGAIMSFAEKLEYTTVPGTKTKEYALADTVGILYPIVAYALSDAAGYTEFQERVQKLLDEYSANKVVKNATLAAVSDSFLHEVCATITEDKLKIEGDELAIETVQKGYESGLLDLVDWIENADIETMDLEALDGITLRKSTTGGTSTKKDSGRDALKNGTYHVPYEWSEEQIARIPSKSMLDEFIISPEFTSILNKVSYRMGKCIDRLNAGASALDAIGKDYVNTMIVGKPGTGKTTLAYNLGAALHVPVYTVPCSKNTEEDTFQGMNKLVKGNFDFVTTDFLKAYTEGGIIVLEEINLADPAVIMGALGQAIEAPFILARDGYDTVRRHPLCVIIATMNVGTFGSKGVSQAFSSRLKQTYQLNDPREEDFIDVLLTVNDNRKICKWIYDAYQKVCSYLRSPDVNQEELCLNVTMRACLGALENIEEGDAPKEALRHTLVGKIAEVDLELAQEIEKNVINSLPNIK